MLRGELSALVLLRGHGQEITQNAHAFGYMKRSLENVRVRQIAAFALECSRWSNAEAAARARIEQRGEKCRAVETRPAQPIERAIARNEPRGAAVTDERV